MLKKEDLNLLSIFSKTDNIRKLSEVNKRFNRLIKYESFSKDNVFYGINNDKNTTLSLQNAMLLRLAEYKIERDSRYNIRNLFYFEAYSEQFSC